MSLNYHGEYIAYKRYRIECHRCGWTKITNEKWYAEWLFNKHDCPARRVDTPSPGTIAAQIQADTIERERRIKERREYNRRNTDPPF